MLKKNDDEKRNDSYAQKINNYDIVDSRIVLNF